MVNKDEYKLGRTVSEEVLFCVLMNENVYHYCY